MQSHWRCALKLPNIKNATGEREKHVETMFAPLEIQFGANNLARLENL